MKFLNGPFRGGWIQSLSDMCISCENLPVYWHYDFTKTKATNKCYAIDLILTENVKICWFILQEKSVFYCN